MRQLPFVLAGPIVRRVELGRVAVWIALSRPAWVKLHVYQGGNREAAPGGGVVGSAEAVAVGEARTHRCGPRLHVALVETGAVADAFRTEKTISPPLNPASIYSYDLSFRSFEEAFESTDLRRLGLLRDDPKEGRGPREIENVFPDAPRHLALGYEENVLPTFATPAAEAKHVRLAQASCRKMHGPGTDAIAYLDELVEETRDNAAERVQQLFLTGDQIYADDVATCALPMIHDLAVALMTEDGEDAGNGEEELPVGQQAQRVNMATAPPLCRGGIVRTDGGFTSSGTANHLLTFGEYAALYLLSWSPNAWGQLADEAASLRFSDADDPDTPSSRFSRTRLGPLFAKEGEPPLRGDALRGKLREWLDLRSETQRVVTFAGTVGKVARVLANTPTLMIFDDHDVTDDWNINGAFVTRVYPRPLGRTVVRNAVLAYTLFQGLGNDWASFVKSAEQLEKEALGEFIHPEDLPANREFLPAAGDYLLEVRGRSAAAAAILDRLFGFPGTSGDRMRFHYSAPGLCHDTLVLDSRTRRTFATPTGLHAPHLLGDSLEDQVPAEPTLGRQFLLLVTSTPVLGPELFEKMVLPALIAVTDRVRAGSDFKGQSETGGEASSPENLAARRTRGALNYDFETWSSHEAGQHALLRRLVTHHPVVMLGGDVHYGTNLMMDIWVRESHQGPDPEAGGRARLVQLTSSASRNAFNKQVEAIYSGYHWFNQWVAGPVVAGFGWRNPGAMAAPGMSLNRAVRLKHRPAILPAEGWPAGTAFFPDEEPDWRFQITALGDRRPDAERGGSIAEAAEEMEHRVEEAARLPRGLERSRKIATLHAMAQDRQFAPLRQMVMANNVGLIRFEEAGDGTVTVVHSLVSTTEPGYPEDEPDEAALAARPLGSGFDPSPGNANTEIKVPMPQPAGDGPGINRVSP